MTSDDRSPAAAENGRPLIVAVDDEPDILRVLELALGDDGFDVLAVLRRSKPEAPAALGVAEFGKLKVDFVRRLVTVDGQTVHLTRNEWRLLEQFARNPGRIISHEELLTRAWGPEFAHDVDYLRVWL